MQYQLIQYIRDNGPICYEILYFDRNDLLGFADKLFSVNLDWYWMTNGSGDSWPDNSLASRPITKLSPEKLDAFCNDFLERNLSGYNRFISIFGLNKNHQSFNEEGLNDAIENFSIYEQGPIQIVILQIGDSNYDQIFVPHAIGEQAKKLLESWEITPERIEKKYKYKRLSLATLESLFDISTE